MSSQLSERPVHIITGATGGIGQALCRILNQSGAELMLAGRDAAKLEALSAELGDAPTFSLATGDSADYAALVRTTVQHFGRLDGIAHCIGSLAIKPLTALNDDEIQDLLATNLVSAIYLVRAVEHMLPRQRPASIVLVASAAGEYGLPHQEVIAAAKGGIAALVRSAAASLAPEIRVNGVAPGLIETPLTEPLRASSTAREASRAMFPMARFGTADDVADAIAFLLDARHGFVTGQIWAIDGGLSSVHASRSHVRAKARDAAPMQQQQQNLDEQVRFGAATATD